MIKLGTQAPAMAIGRDDVVGSLKPGTAADVAIFRLKEGPIEFRDARGDVRQGDKVLEPVETVRAGRRFSPFHAAHRDHTPPAGF